MNFRVNKKIIKYIGIVCIALFGAFIFHVSPDDNMDFVRYQSILRSIRLSQIDFWDFWRNGTQISREVGAAQKYAFCENILIYIVAKFFTNDYILVWLSIFIDYTCIAYIAFDIKYNSRYSFLQIIVSILVCFAELPFIHACSGLRTATASCVMAVAVYVYLYKQCKTIFFIILSVLAIGFHPCILFAIIIALAIGLTKNNITIIGVIFGIMLLPEIVKKFMNSQVPFLVMLAQKYITYTSDNQFRAYRTFKYGTILVCVLCIVYLLFEGSIGKKLQNSNRLKTDKLKNVKTFFIAYMCIILGNVNSYELVVRLGYLIGAMAPLLSLSIFGYRCEKNNYVYFTIRFAIIVLTMVMSVTYIKYYYQWFVI